MVSKFIAWWIKNVVCVILILWFALKVTMQLSTGSSFAGVQCMLGNTVGPKVLWTKRAGQNQGPAKMSVGLETQKER